MPGGHVTVTGLEGVVQRLGSVGAASRRPSGRFLAFGSPEPYARFIETGRSSRQVRRAGPAWMFREGIKEVMQGAGQLLGAAVAAGEQATNAAIGDIERRGIQAIQRRTPVRTGRLRGSVRASGRFGGL